MCCLGFPLGDKSCSAFVFADPEPITSHKNMKSSTGCIKVDIFEATITTEVSAPRVVAQPLRVPPLNVPPSSVLPSILPPSQPAKEEENNKPLEKPSLKTCPGRTITLSAPPVPRAPPVAPASASALAPSASNTMCNPASVAPPLPSPPPIDNVWSVVWWRVREEPDASLEVRCHTADSLDFLQAFHEDRAARTAANHVPADLTAVPDVQVKAEAPSVPSEGPAAVNPGVFDLTKMDTSTMDLTIEPPGEVEFIGSIIKKTKRKKPKKVQKEGGVDGASGALPRKMTTKSTAKPSVKTESGSGEQPAKKVKKAHPVHSTPAPARDFAPHPTVVVVASSSNSAPTTET